MIKNLFTIKLCFFMFLIFSKLSFSEIYTWVDEDGKKHFSDKPILPERTNNTVTSHRASDNIRKGFDSISKDIYVYYDSLISSKKDIKGNVSVWVEIDASGKVSKYELRNVTTNNKALESFIVEKIKVADFGAEEVRLTTTLYIFQFPRQ